MIKKKFISRLFSLLLSICYSASGYIFNEFRPDLNKEKTGVKMPSVQSEFVKLNTVTRQSTDADYTFQLRIGDALSLQWRGEACTIYIHQLVKALSA